MLLAPVPWVRALSKGTYLPPYRPALRVLQQVTLLLAHAHLQRQSKLLNHSTVSAVLEETLRILSADRRGRLSDRFDQRLAAASFGFL